MFRNSRGRRVDPVPFLVVTLLAVMVCYSCGPLYLKAWGFSMTAAVALTTLVVALVTALAYYRLVWTYHPELRADVPVEYRFRRFVLIAAVLGLLLFVLSVPMLV